MKKVVKYRRVSTKEQSLRGYSLDAQNEVLDKYIKENQWVCVGDYMDDGHSASSSKRPALTRLLEDVQMGGIDLIIFTKLDRWFRSVSQYYKIQDVLDQYNVPWRTVLEDYNTETSDGKFKVNIMLSVAQNEIDKTSERIKDVFDSKLLKKQAITGAQPFGYKIENHVIVKDPNTQHIVQDIFDTFEQLQSIRQTLIHINNKYNYEMAYSTICNSILSNPKYTGMFRGIPDYYPPYLSAARFDHLQSLMSKNIKSNNHTEYIFSRMVICAECGKSMTGTKSGIPGGKSYHYYRCNNSVLTKRCSNRHRYAEKKLEQAILTRIQKEVESYLIEVNKSASNQVDVSALRAEILEEMERVNFMFQKRRITVEKYDYECGQLEHKLSMLTKSNADAQNLERILQTDFMTFYKELPPVDKRLIWRSIIDKIILRNCEEFEIVFL